jgi:type III secretion protein Q
MPSLNTHRELSSADFMHRMQPQQVQFWNQWQSLWQGLKVSLKNGSCLLQTQWFDAASIQEVFHLKIGGYGFELGLNAAAQAYILDEYQAARLPRHLRLTLLAEALSNSIQALEKIIGQTIEWVLNKPDQKGHDVENLNQTITLPFTLKQDETKAASNLGYIRFENLLALRQLIQWVSLAQAEEKNHAASALAFLQIPLSFRIGCTHLSIKEINHIEPGDIISIESWQSIGSAIGVQIYGGNFENLHLEAIAKNNKVTVQDQKEKIMGKAAGEGLQTFNSSLNRLDAMEVTLDFHVGDLAVSLGELKTVGSGHIFELSEPINRSAVRIVASGHVLGHGHLVAVGERLGVRVSEFAPQVSDAS